MTLNQKFRKRKGETKSDGTESPVTDPTDEKVPDLCDGSFDVITNVRKEIFIFKEQVFWKKKYLIEVNYEHKCTRVENLRWSVKGVFEKIIGRGSLLWKIPREWVPIFSGFFLFFVLKI